MPRMTHGSTVSLEQVQDTTNAINDLNNAMAMPVTFAPPRLLTEFGYMFEDLQSDPQNLLLPGSDTVANLIRLGESMRDMHPFDEDGNNRNIPTAYVFLGQFIDHDITLETMSDTFGVLDDSTVLSSFEKVLQRIMNMRSATLDLDSVYKVGSSELSGPRMRIGQVSLEGHPVPGKDGMNDLPRAPRDPIPRFDRFALIGDFRNDENLVISQLHLAFLRAHNAIVNLGNTRQGAERILRQLHQWVAIHDFLRRVCGDAVVDGVLTNGNRFFIPSDEEFFMPLEFSVAVYRFGHSMVPAVYDYNVNFGPNGIQGPGTLEELFTFSALMGQLGVGGGFDTLPENHVIQWENFLNSRQNPTRKIDTRLVEPLFHLRDEVGGELAGVAARLAVRNLLRGYKLRIPTGQAVAQSMGMPALNPADLISLILANADRVQMIASEKDALSNAGFDMRTPLWFYVLAEAELLEGGARLGPVGGTIVAEVLIGLAQRSADSIFDLGTGWNPSLLSGQLEQEINPNFELIDLLKMAGVL